MEAAPRSASAQQEQAATKDEAKAQPRVKGKQRLEKEAMKQAGVKGGKVVTKPVKKYAQYRYELLRKPPARFPPAHPYCYQTCPPNVPRYVSYRPLTGPILEQMRHENTFCRQDGCGTWHLCLVAVYRDPDGKSGLAYWFDHLGNGIQFVHDMGTAVLAARTNLSQVITCYEGVWEPSPVFGNLLEWKRWLAGRKKEIEKEWAVNELEVQDVVALWVPYATHVPIPALGPQPAWWTADDFSDDDEEEVDEQKPQAEDTALKLLSGGAFQVEYSKKGSDGWHCIQVREEDLPEDDY